VEHITASGTEIRIGHALRDIVAGAQRELQLLTKFNLILSALELFAENGIDAVSMRTINNAAGTKNASYTTSPSTCAATAGVPAYTYAWTYVSGDASFTCNFPTAAATSFTRSSMVLGTTYTTFWKCTVTDSTSATAVANICVSIDRDTLQ